MRLCVVHLIQRIHWLRLYILSQIVPFDAGGFRHRFFFWFIFLLILSFNKALSPLILFHVFLVHKLNVDFLLFDVFLFFLLEALVPVEGQAHVRGVLALELVQGRLERVLTLVVDRVSPQIVRWLVQGMQLELGELLRFVVLVLGSATGLGFLVGTRLELELSEHLWGPVLELGIGF